MGSAGHDAHGVAHPRPHPRGERPEPRRPTRRSPLISRGYPVGRLAASDPEYRSGGPYGDYAPRGRRLIRGLRAYEGTTRGRPRRGGYCLCRLRNTKPIEAEIASAGDRKERAASPNAPRAKLVVVPRADLAADLAAWR